MLKNLKYLVVAALVAFGYSEGAHADFFTTCTASKGKKGGTGAHKCIEEGKDNPNFYAAFNSFHCQPGRIRKEDRVYCEMVRQFLGEAQDNVHKVKQAKQIKREKASTKSRANAKAKADRELDYAQNGKPGIKERFSKLFSKKKKADASAPLGRRNAGADKVRKARHVETASRAPRKRTHAPSAKTRKAQHGHAGRPHLGRNPAPAKGRRVPHGHTAKPHLKRRAPAGLHKARVHKKRQRHFAERPYLERRDTLPAQSPRAHSFSRPAPVHPDFGPLVREDEYQDRDGQDDDDRQGRYDQDDGGDGNDDERDADQERSLQRKGTLAAMTPRHHSSSRPAVDPDFEQEADEDTEDEEGDNTQGREGDGADADVDDEGYADDDDQGDEDQGNDEGDDDQRYADDEGQGEAEDDDDQGDAEGDDEGGLVDDDDDNYEP